MISLLPSPPTPPSSPGSDPAWLMRPPIRTPPRNSRSVQEKLLRYKSLGIQNSKGLMKKKAMVNLRIDTSTRPIDNSEPITPPPFRTLPSLLQKARAFPSSETLNWVLDERVEEALSGRRGPLSGHKYRGLVGDCVDHLKNRMSLAVRSEVQHILSLRRLKGYLIKSERDLNSLINGQCDAWIGRFLIPRAPLVSISVHPRPSFQPLLESAGHWPPADNLSATSHHEALEPGMECGDSLHPVQGHLDILSTNDEAIWV